jgi:hypothetical protein
LRGEKISTTETRRHGDTHKKEGRLWDGWGLVFLRDSESTEVAEGTKCGFGSEAEVTEPKDRVSRGGVAGRGRYPPQRHGDTEKDIKRKVAGEMDGASSSFGILRAQR